MKSLKFYMMLSVLITFGIFTATAQLNNDEVLLKISGKNVTVGEFMSIYQKNYVKGDVIDKKSLEEYLNLFINYKLKVMEAEELGLDTVAANKTELKGYRDQLAKPFFTDEATIDRLVKEAYDREQIDIRASHIVFRLRANAMPADTLAVYEKALKIRERILNGESFEAMAMEFSDDQSAKDKPANQQHPLIRGNHGDLGYFTVFSMIYPFENGAYLTEVGQVSMPIRTEYGYHLIKPVVKRKAMGKVTVSRIYIAFPARATAQDSLNVKARIDSVYLKLKSGEKFDMLVKKYSMDEGTKQKAGQLPELGVDKVVPDLIDGIYKLDSAGQFTEPLLAVNGYHIFKLIRKKVPGTFEEEKADLKQRVMKDIRGLQAKETVITRVKNELGYKENLAARDDFYDVVTDSIFFGKWKAEQAAGLNKNLLTIGKNTYTQKDFTDYLISKQRKREKEPIASFVNRLYKDFSDDCVIKAEDAQLETKYPEFRALMKEYRDGIILFDLTERKVWSMAVKDTTGLQKFYQKNKKNYMWDKRLEASIYKVKDSSVVQKVKNFITTGLNDGDILKSVNSDSLKILVIESGKYAHKDNAIIDSIEWKTGFSKNIIKDNSTVFVYVRKILKPEPKLLNEARGLITADYQNYLEKAWIDALRVKYPVEEINKEVLVKIK